MNPKEILRTTLKLDNNAVLDAILSHGKVRNYKKGDILYECGAVPQEIGVQLSGVVALIVPTDHGRLAIDCIADRAGMPIMPVSGMDKPANCTFRVLTDAQIFMCPTAVIAGLLAENPALQASFIALVRHSMQNNLENRRVLQGESVRERYEWFLKKHPNFPPRGLNKYVAAYLNTTPETISRIRRELDKENGDPAPESPTH